MDSHISGRSAYPDTPRLIWKAVAFLLLFGVAVAAYIGFMRLYAKGQA